MGFEGSFYPESRFGGFERPPVEYGQTLQGASLVRIQQSVAPRDGRIQRLVAVGAAALVLQELQSVADAVHQTRLVFCPPHTIDDVFLVWR